MIHLFCLFWSKKLVIMRFCLFTSLLFLLFSCGAKEEKICECLEVGDRFNQLSSELLGSNDVSEEQRDEMISLKKEKTKKCADFQTMSGEEMLKRKAECE